MTEPIVDDEMPEQTDNSSRPEDGDQDAIVQDPAVDYSEGSL